MCERNAKKATALAEETGIGSKGNYQPGPVLSSVGNYELEDDIKAVGGMLYFMLFSFEATYHREPSSLSEYFRGYKALMVMKRAENGGYASE